MTARLVKEREWTIVERYRVSETDRRAVGLWINGEDKMAPLAQVRRFVRSNGLEGLDAAVIAFHTREGA